MSLVEDMTILQPVKKSRACTIAFSVRVNFDKVGLIVIEKRDINGVGGNVINLGNNNLFNVAEDHFTPSFNNRFSRFDVL